MRTRTERGLYTWGIACTLVPTTAFLLAAGGEGSYWWRDVRFPPPASRRIHIPAAGVYVSMNFTPQYTASSLEGAVLTVGTSLNHVPPTPRDHSETLSMRLARAADCPSCACFAPRCWYADILGCCSQYKMNNCTEQRHHARSYMCYSTINCMLQHPRACLPFCTKTFHKFLL